MEPQPRRHARQTSASSDIQPSDAASACANLAKRAVKGVNWADSETTMSATQERVPVAGPSITDLEVEWAARAAREGWYANHYAFNAKFEQMVADYVGVRHAVSLPHCTAALHLALAATGIGPGDEVIVPDATWIASVAPVAYCSADPVFVDVRADTWCIDPDALEAAIGPRTKAVIGVDLYGSMCDWTRLTKIADQRGLILIEDAAEAIGSSFGGRLAGAFGSAATFSFHGSKTVATGEGGMLVTNDEKLRDRVLFLRDHGRPPGDRVFLNTEIGFKYRMNAVTAALGIAQMSRIDELIAMKRRIFAWYRDRLAGAEGVTLNAEPEGAINSYWMVTAVVDESFGLDKFALMAGMDAKGIDTRPFFTPLSELPAFAGRSAAKRFMSPASTASQISRRAINLPSGYNLDEAKVDRVCRAFCEVLQQRKPPIRSSPPN